MSEHFYDGEKPLKDAPSVKLRNGASCIPQHYLKYQHTLLSVQKIVLGCYFDNRYPIFVGEDEHSIYIQIGIVGYDNYKRIEHQAKKKIVYGRRWRVEPELPTSEIIQTIFLALKKAREHEVREVLKLSIRQRITTPFSCHQDLPLMARNASLLENTQSNELTLRAFTERICQLLSHIQYDHSIVELINIEERKNGNLLIDLKVISSPNAQLVDVKQVGLTLILQDKSINEFLYCLMDMFVQLSDRYVEEHFTFQGFKRFSRQNDLQEIAELSLETREKVHINDTAFQHVLALTNYETDKSRVPTVIDTDLAKNIAKTLSCFGALDGILPNL
jgi:hypothetical protein